NPLPPTIRPRIQKPPGTSWWLALKCMNTVTTEPRAPSTAGDVCANAVEGETPRASAARPASPARSHAAGRSRPRPARPGRKHAASGSRLRPARPIDITLSGRNDEPESRNVAEVVHVERP